MSQRRDRTSPTCPDGPITQATVGPVVHISGAAQESETDLSTLARRVSWRVSHGAHMSQWYIYQNSYDCTWV